MTATDHPLILPSNQIVLVTLPSAQIADTGKAEEDERREEKRKRRGKQPLSPSLAFFHNVDNSVSPYLQSPNPVLGGYLQCSAP